MKKFVCILLLLISITTMYYFSSQDGKTASKQSHIVAEIVDEIRDRVTLKDENLIRLKDKIRDSLKGYKKDIVIRKAAHFGMYIIIGGLMMIVIYLFSKQVIFSACISFAFTFLYAVYDERRQLTIDGRAGSLQDVFIDASGALLAISMLSCIFLFWKGTKFILRRDKEEECIEE